MHDGQEGLLGLTARNDNTSEAVTKEDVVQYITQEVTRRIEAMQSQNIEPAIIEEISELNIAQIAVELPIGYLPQQVQQILQELQGFVSAEQLMGSSPELRNIIISSVSVRHLMSDNGVTFEQVNQLYDQSPEKLKKIANIDVRQLMSDNGVTFEQVNQLYDQSPETLEGIASYGVRSLPPEEFQARLQLVIQRPSTSITNPQRADQQNNGRY